MGKDKLVLADGTEMELESSRGIGALCVIAESRTAAGALWEKFYGENLSEVLIKNSTGDVAGRYKDMVLDHITGADYGDSVLITFNLREKTETELLRERVAALESGQKTQDEAIGDLGQAVSDIAEGEGEIL